MAKASKELLASLEEKINAAADGLKSVTGKRMFGCHALFVKDAVFGLIWKEGRIGVRLPETSVFDELIGLKGAGPWKAGPMTMSHWVLVPATMHEDRRALTKWVTKAHSIAATTAPKVAAKKKALKKTAKKPQAKPAKKTRKSPSR